MQPRLETRRGAVMATACCVSALLNTTLQIVYGGEAGAQRGERSEFAPLRYGPFDLRPTIRGSIVYDDNILIQPEEEQSDLIWTFSPGVTIGTGDYGVKEESFATLAYMPSFILFTEHSDNNAIDHDARFRAQYHPGKWTFTLGQDYLAVSGAVIDVGDRISRDIYTTALSVQYEISPKTSVELTGTQSINDYETIVNFNEWVIGAWTDYWITPKIKVGIGANGGFLDIRQSGNQRYQQGLVRVVYSVTEKVEARGSVGFELRQFDGGENENTPVFSLGTTFKAQENTSISLEAYRRNQNSVSFVDQNFIVSGGSLSIRQLLSTRYALHLATGYDHADYRPTVRAAANGESREDNYLYVRTGVECKLTERLRSGLFYQYRRNNSNLDRFRFDNNQVGLNMSYQF